jgi:hypothetical protein
VARDLIGIGLWLKAPKEAHPWSPIPSKNNKAKDELREEVVVTLVSAAAAERAAGPVSEPSQGP